jgi:hypothetical protein
LAHGVSVEKGSTKASLSQIRKTNEIAQQQYELIGIASNQINHLKIDQHQLAKSTKKTGKGSS